MLVLASTCWLRLLVMAARLSSERFRFSATEVRLVLALARVALALERVPSSNRPVLVGHSHSPKAPGRSRCAVAAARLVTTGRASRAITLRLELRVALFPRTMANWLVSARM